MSEAASYRILGTLGSGAMGVVYRALQVSLKREVAVKTTRGDLDADPDILKRFEREARAMMKVRHPHLIEVLDAGVQDGRPYIAMELIQGRTLSQLVASDPVGTRRRADRIFGEVLEAVAALHDAGIVHRDLKPVNVMVTTEGRAVVMDLGLVREFEERRTRLTETGTAVGTPAYLAPEVVLGAPATTSADVWALGCLYFFLHAGRSAFTGSSLPELFGAITTRPLPKLEVACADLPPHRRAFLASLLERNPDVRPHDANAVLERFRRGAPSAGAVRTRRSSRALAAAALVAAGFGGVLGGFLLRGRPATVVTLAPLSATPRTTPAEPPEQPGASAAEVIGALARLNVPRLQADFDAELGARPRAQAALPGFMRTLREAWKSRIDRELARAGIRELIPRAALDTRASAIDVRATRYRLACGLWLLLGRLREVGADPALDLTPLFPSDHHPDLVLPPLDHARTIGVRWRETASVPFLTGPEPRLVDSPHKGDLRMFTDDGTRGLSDSMTEGLSLAVRRYAEPALIPLRPPAPGERVLAALGGKHLSPTASLAVRFSTDGKEWGPARFFFRGERDGTHAEHYHWVDPDLITGPVYVRLDYDHPDSVGLTAEIFVYWLMFHYVPAR